MSTGFETTSTMASFRRPFATISPRIDRNKTTLRLMSASRLSSGFRRRPAVMQITSASARQP